jgi:protein-disulfide isomerase
MRWLMRLGALGSLGFIIIMIVGTYICPYCLTIHIANLSLIAILEAALPAKRVAAMPRPALATLLIAFVAVNLALLPIELTTRSAQARDRQAQQKEDIDEIIKRGNEDESNDPRDAVPADHPFADRPFIGRYPRGPEAAPIRIVMITDYQCPDCRYYERQLEVILRQRDDVQVSIMHFPFCTLCNPHVQRNLHPNACWAARAAEAAGILGGADAFWKMHFDLFERKGSFTDDTIQELVGEVGLDFQAFLRTMQSDETLERVTQDIEVAKALGLTFTPMIFINGRQVRLFGTGQDLTGAVNAIAAANLPPRTADADLPDLAVEKYIGDWQESKPFNFPASNRPWANVDPEAPLRIVLFGDYNQPITTELNRRLRERLADVEGVSFTWRHFPFNTECNEQVKATMNALACEAARAAEAAGHLGGEDMYWAMHDWLMKREGDLPNGFARQAAEELGLDVEQFSAVMRQPEIDSIIQQDVALSKLARVRGVPSLFINERRLARWRLEDDSFDMIQAVFDRALQGQ